jgi:CDP-4-dehydro-6-deoxyglucose reductase
MVTATLANGRAFQVNAGVSLLDAALITGITLPYSCKTGRCSTCKCKVIDGTTTVLQTETGLSGEEKAEGWILSCVRTATTDITLEAEDLEGAVLAAPKTLPCRISAIDRLTPDVVRVMLRLPPSADFSFIPGQYIDVIGPGGIRRSYSLANASAAEKLLEMHIRSVDGGAMSAYWFDQAKANDLLRLNGPLGTFFLRNTADTDLVFLATGTGIAPVKAMLESIADRPSDQRPKSITVLWGGRTAEDMYLDFKGIAADHHFVPVLSRGGAGWTGAKGYVQQALLSHHLDLSNAAVYACGSDAMIQSAKAVLEQAGLPAKRFYSDAFVCSATT